MKESVQAGRIIEMESTETLSDGSAGGIEPGAITFDICQVRSLLGRASLKHEIAVSFLSTWIFKELVDEWVTVSEREIEDAIYLAHK